MKEKTLLSIKLLSSHIILIPVLLLISFFIKTDSNLMLIISQVLLLIVFLSGYWEFFGLKFRLYYFCSIEALILFLFFYKLSMDGTHFASLPIEVCLGIILGFLLFELVKIFIVILKRDKLAAVIDFPLKNGRYLITDGGNSRISRLMNYHYYSSVHKKNKTNNSMKFAVDIVKIDSSKRSFLPADNKDYPIFGERVYSPVPGVVIKIENDINDNIPFSGNYPYNTGNTVVIRDGAYCMLIGHLMKGSIRVREGETVQVNDLIALAGNSGYSERAHIHMQLINSPDENFWYGKGVNISFQNRSLYKNRVIDLH